MRYIYIICFTLLFSLTGQAQTKRTINVATAGTLPNYISDSEKYTIEELTLTGNLNGTDFRLLRDMAGCNYLGEYTNGQLKVLDISGANIVTGGVNYVDTEKLPEYPGSYHYNVEKANEIPKYVFHGCKKLVTLRIANTITSLQDYAFCFCESLTSFTIPNSVTSIGSHTFSDCYGLTSITIPNNVTSIGVRAFQFCSGLTSFTIPSSVTSIDNNPVAWCSNLSSIVVASGNTKYDSRNNCNAIIEKSSNKLISGCKNTVIPNGVTIIDAYAFRGSSGLSSITIPNSVTSIGVAAFNGCSSLTSITIPNSVTKIETGAFSSCPGLTSVISEIQNPFKIDNEVFSSDTYTKAPLTVPYGTKSKYQSTNGWKNFTNIVESTPSTKRTINVATAGTLPNYISDSEKYLIEELTLTGELNGTDFRLLRDMAGNDYQGFSTDGRLAVLDMSGAKIVAGGEKYMDIISSSMSYTVEKANELPIVVFRNCIKLTSVVLPNTVSSLQDLAFWSCNALTSITIPKSVTSIGMNPFIFCNNLSSIVVESGNTKYDSRNNCNAIIEKSSNTLISGCKNTVIPNGVTSIGDYAFGGCSNLTSITIPNSVTSIGSSAFQGCSGFTSITIPNSVTSIGSYAFQRCSSLTSITIPNGVTSIEESTFNYCTSLTSITIPGNVTSIGSNAFNNCTGLTSVISEIQNPFEFPYPVFSLNTYNNATLTVPYGTKSKYQATSYWNNFKNIVESEGPITVTAQSYSRKYGEANPTFDYTVSGGTLNGTPLITCDATSSSSVGTYTIEISRGSVTNSNVRFVDGTLTVTKAPLTITANSYTRKQGEQNPTFEVTYSGFKNGETESVLTKKPTVTTTATIDSPPGTYDIVASGAEAKNYDMSYVKGTLTVTAADAIVVTAQSYSRKYGEANPTFDYTVSGGTLNGTPLISCDVTSSSSVGTYTIKISKGSVTNSNVTFVDGTLTVTKAPLTITAKSYTRKQGEQNPTFEVTYSGFKNGETESVLTKKPTVTTTATIDSPPGTYDIVASGAEAKNYDISYVKGTLTVTENTSPSTSRTINVATAGTLPNYISDSEKYTIEELTLTGNLNGTDFRLLRDMAGNNYKGEITEGKLKILDLTGAKIVAGGEKYLDTDKIYYNNNSSSSTGSWHLTVDYANMLPQSVFEACEKLTSVSVPNTVTSIEYYAFKNCNGLTSITIPASVTSIGSWAFSNCASLASITIPSTVTEIGANPFAYCSALSAVSVQSGNTKYDSRNNCNAIIETSSNKLITGCKNTVIPSTVTRIGDTAFGGCTGLTSVTFPNLVTSIDDYAFQMCTRLGSVTLPNALTTIGQFAFYGCTDLTAITIPNSVTSIGDFAFNLCLDLNAVTSEIVNPFEISDMVFSTYSSATLTVPSGTKSKYQSTNYWNKFATIEEKLNDGEVVFLTDNIEYKGNKNTQKAAVQSVENSLTQVVIPASVTYGGQTYQVTSIADDILSNRTFSYVSLPSTITSISSSTFRGSTLGALIWNADATLSSGVFSNMNNKVDANFLLYVNNQSYAPSNVKNVVVGNTASSITLADAKNTMFYCPRQFTATTISYTHKYSMETGGSGKGWESISLPFDVKKIEHATKGEITPFASYDANSSQRPFWLYEMGSNGFKKTSTIKANTPYIISMPNSSAYDNEYILTGNVTFSATNATVATTSPVSVTAGSKRFVPAFSVVEKSAAVYALNVTNDLVTDHGAYDAGSRFVSDLREVYPFEAYMTTSSSAPYLTIEFDNGATGMMDEGLRMRESAADSIVVIYSLGGQKVVTCKQADFDSRWLNLPSGVYIVNGKKRIR